MNVLIVGRGRVGNGITRSLRRAGEHRVVAAGRTPRPRVVRGADLVVLAVSDDAIQSAAEGIAPHLGRRTAVVHCAGARGEGELRACAARGAPVGVMHPMASFPSKDRSPNLEGTTWTVHGDRVAISACRNIAKSCGARVVVSATDDPAYHGAAALAANGAAALAYVSVTVLERLGFDRRAAERAVGGLLRTVGENVATLGVPAALTGPIARGDAETVARHRATLRRFGRDARATYDASVPFIVRCARAAGLPASKARRILRAVNDD